MDNIRLEDLDEKYRHCASVIGIDSFVALCEKTGGIPIYPPNIDTLLKSDTYKRVIEDHKKGVSVQNLSKTYKISVSTIYNLIKGIIKIEDLAEKYKEYIEIIGIDKLILLSKQFGGVPLYIPKVDNLFKLSKDKRVMEAYKKGISIKDIVKTYKISERTVYNLIKKKL